MGNSTRKIKFGIIGRGAVARARHVPEGKQATNAALIGVSSRDFNKARAFADEFDIPKAYGSHEDLLADPEIEAVINPLPTHLHCDWTIKAARAGKHVLVEKPFAVTSDEAKRMAGAARDNNVLIMEGFVQHQNPAMQFVRKTLDSGEIGEIRLVRMEQSYTIQDWENDSRANAEMAGGALLEAGCYGVYTVRFVTGREPTRVHGFWRVRQPNNVDTTFAGLLVFRGDVLAYITSCQDVPFRSTCEIVGTKGTIEVPSIAFGPEVRVTTSEGKRIESFDRVKRFKKQLEHFSDCILTGKPPIISPEDSIKNAVVLDAFRKSIQEERVVEIKGG